MAAWRPDLTVTPEYLARHAVFVAEAGGAAVGFCALEEEPSAWTLAHLWVHPEHHGRGIGSALFERAARYAAGRRPDAPIRIVADPHAEAFYRRSGARRIGREQAPVDGHPRELPVLLFEAT